jgi:putative addiction module component (TIGR02574 family)
MSELFSQALGLPVESRQELALLLLNSLPVCERSIELDPDYEAELVRRLEEIDTGRANMLTLDEVMARLQLPSATP